VAAAAAGGGGDATGSGTAAAAVAVVVVGVDGSVLDASSALGAVDARVGGDDVAAGLLLLLLLLWVDIGPSWSRSGACVAHQHTRHVQVQHP
jgi:hypothetical protein